MGRALDGKRNSKDNEAEKKSRKKENEGQIIFKSIIQSLIYSVVIYLFGISTLCIGSLDPNEFKKIFPEFPDVEKLSKDGSITCDDPKLKKPQEKYALRDHTHVGGSKRGKRIQRGGETTKTSESGDSVLNKKLKQANIYIAKAGKCFQNEYEMTDAAINNDESSGILNNPFFKWARLYRWTMFNSITNSFWYGPFKWMTTCFQGLGKLGNILYQNDFVTKLSKQTVQNARENKSGLIDKFKILGGVIAGGFLAFVLIFGIFCLGLGAMFYTVYKGALPADNFSKGWGSLGVLFNPFIIIPAMAMGPIVSPIYAALSIFGGMYYRRKVLTKLLFSNLLLFFVIFCIIFLAKLAASGVSDTIWIAAFIAPFIAVGINFKRIVELFKRKKGGSQPPVASQS